MHTRYTNNMLIQKFLVSIKELKYLLPKYLCITFSNSLFYLLIIQVGQSLRKWLQPPNAYFYNTLNSKVHRNIVTLDKQASNYYLISTFLTGKDIVYLGIF